MRYAVLVGLVCLLLMGCGAPEATVTPAPTPTVDVRPTQTRAAEISQLATLGAPTATPPPTNTPSPPTAIPTQIPPTVTATKAVTATPIPPTATATATTPPPTQTPIPVTATATTPPAPTIVVSQLVAVVDGATITVRLPDNTNASVLLIGVDAPVPNECYGAESAARINTLLQGRTVELEADALDKDQGGRLLRYVWVWGEDGVRRQVNLEMAKGGLAAVYSSKPNVRYEADMAAAQKAAQAQKLGLWSTCGKAHAPIPPTPTPLGRCSNADAQRLLNTIQPKAQEWDDANKLASSTPRVSLAAQIQNLQRIRRESAGLSVPACGSFARTLMVSYMDATINGYIDFLGQGTQANTLFAQAKTLIDAFNVELKKVTVGP